MEVVNPVLEEYLAAIMRGDRSFGIILYPEELTCLNDLGLDDYETEPAPGRKLYVKVHIKTG